MLGLEAVSCDNLSVLKKIKKVTNVLVCSTKCRYDIID